MDTPVEDLRSRHRRSRILEAERNRTHLRRQRRLDDASPRRRAGAKDLNHQAPLAGRRSVPRPHAANVGGHVTRHCTVGRAASHRGVDARTGALTTNLADLGADVIKVEPPQGDYGRQMTWPIVNGVSLLFLHISRGKRSVVLDLRTDAGRDTFLSSPGTPTRSWKPCARADSNAGGSGSTRCGR